MAATSTNLELRKITLKSISHQIHPQKLRNSQKMSFFSSDIPINNIKYYCIYVNFGIYLGLGSSITKTQFWYSKGSLFLSSRGDILKKSSATEQKLSL